MIDQETQALYDILLEAGMSEEQLKEGLEERERTGKNYRDIVLDYGFCNESELTKLIAENLGCEIVENHDVLMCKSEIHQALIIFIALNLCLGCIFVRKIQNSAFFYRHTEIIIYHLCRFALILSVRI